MTSKQTSFIFDNLNKSVDYDPEKPFKAFMNSRQKTHSKHKLNTFKQQTNNKHEIATAAECNLSFIIQAFYQTF